MDPFEQMMKAEAAVAHRLIGDGGIDQCVCASSERLRQLAVWLAAGGQRAGWRSNPPCAH